MVGEQHTRDKVFIFYADSAQPTSERSIAVHVA